MDLTAAPGSGVQAVPYCGPLVAPQDLWSAWNTDPWLIAGLVCAFGVMLAHQRADVAGRAGSDRALVIAFAGLGLAFLSPLCAATVAIFSARALHHLVLICLVAPALALALPLRALPATVGLALTALALVLWHVPDVYDAAWRSDAVYWLLQASLLLPGWIFWSAVLNPRDQGAAALFGHALLVGGLAGVMGLIGAVLTFAPVALYPHHLPGAEALGIGLLADQQLAGLVMWVPGFLPVAGFGFWMLRQGWRREFAA
ncbi:cytochrome c oxidase assembly protein [Szabonella alba]|uniref:Cytochrome c oxidase assembly protein n=1 Tax=Szabonella alba TaxID=2804194 RepID=A0A8K0XZN9_9RHOB|nr:cytochrome c oxidase assembly protein [Szabonella alba]MBL4916996.1 cytochrome c oxidase assembly protein [Szabonella alba]